MVKSAGQAHDATTDPGSAASVWGHRKNQLTSVPDEFSELFMLREVDLS